MSKPEAFIMGVTCWLSICSFIAIVACVIVEKIESFKDWVND